MIVALIAVAAVVAFLVVFLKTRLGLAIRATGNNADMVKSSSINPVFTTIIGLCIANSFTALSGCLLSQSHSSYKNSAFSKNCSSDQKGCKRNGNHSLTDVNVHRFLGLGKKASGQCCGNGIGFFCFPTGLYGGFKI